MTKITEHEVKAYKLQGFNFFIRYFFKQFNGRKFVMNDHHLEIIQALQDVIDGKTKRLIINIAPRYSKTEIAVKNFIAYCLAMNPAAKFIHLSYSDTLALDNSEAIKDFIQSNDFQEFFNVEIKKDSKSKKKWYTDQGGGVYATSAGGQVTGFGAGKVDDENANINEVFDAVENAKGFGGAIIIDDPIKPDDTDSDTIREKINNRFDSTIRSRVNSRNTPIIIVMQRLHPQDLSGYLMDVEPGEWKCLSMPAIKSDGSALWDFKHSIEELEHLRKVNPTVFASQYMQNPAPKEGLMFPPDELNYYDPKTANLDDADATVGFIDVADKGQDWHALPIGKIKGQKVYICDVLFTKEGTESNVSQSIEIMNKHRPEYVQVEANFGGGMYRNLLNVNPSPSINGVTALIDMVAKGNKHVRIQTMAGFIKEYFVFAENFDKSTEYGQFMHNFTEYKKTGGNKHDDAPDALAGLARMILNYYPDNWDTFAQVLNDQ